jgi:hypothetical protein
MKRYKILALAVVLAASAGRLGGQTYRTFAEEYDEVRAKTGVRLGPLKVLPAFRLANVGYDSNVYYADKQDQAVADYTGTLSPEVKGYWLLGSSALVSVMENPEWSFYLKEKDLRTLVNSFVPAVRLFLLRRLALSGDYHFLEHLRQATSELGTPVRDLRKGWSARLFFETPRGTAVGLSGSLEDYAYSNPSPQAPQDEISRALDHRERTAAFEFYYRVFSRSSIFATAGATDYNFLDPASSWRNARSYQTYAGFRFPLLGRARGTIALGYKRFIPRTEGQKSFSGLVADTDVALRTGRVGLSVAYTRDNYFSYIDTAYYYIEDRFRGGLAFYLFPFLRLEGSCRLGAWAYPEPHEVWFHGVPYMVADRRDRNRVFSAGLAVRITGSAGLSVSYNFYRRTSNAPGFDIDRNFIGAALAYDF